MSNQDPPKVGRTQWDLLYEFSQRRSFFVWASFIGWAIVISGAVAWYHDELPVRGGSKHEGIPESSQYLHWSFESTTANHDKCSAASLQVHQTAKANATEMWNRDPAEAVIVGVYDSFVTAVGCTGFSTSPLSIVIVAGPDQTEAQNKEAMLRKLLNSELSR